MTKKLFSKLLSVILIIAICASTVFGCLITANAAQTCYTWSNANVAEDLTATINLTITAPAELTDGIATGMFSLSQHADLTLEKIEITGGAPVDNALSFQAEDFVLGAEGNKYVFESGVPYSQVVFTLTYSFANGTVAKGENYTVNIAANSLSLSTPYGDEYYETASGVAGVFGTGCEHVISVEGLEPDTTADDYYIY